MCPIKAGIIMKTGNEFDMQSMVTKKHPDCFLLQFGRQHGEDWCKKLPGDVATDVMCRRLDHFIRQVCKLQSNVENRAVKLSLMELESDMGEWLDSFSRSDEWRYL